MRVHELLKAGWVTPLANCDAAVLDCMKETIILTRAAHAPGGVRGSAAARLLAEIRRAFLELTRVYPWFCDLNVRFTGEGLDLWDDERPRKVKIRASESRNRMMRPRDIMRAVIAREKNQLLPAKEYLDMYVIHDMYVRLRLPDLLWTAELIGVSTIHTGRLINCYGGVMLMAGSDEFPAELIKGAG
jgi:hypothetical protein